MWYYVRTVLREITTFSLVKKDALYIAAKSSHVICSSRPQRIKRRSIMSEATTIEQLRKKVDLVRPHDDFTAWIRAIQKARIIQLGPEDAWIEDEDLIQVRRMREQDLESKNYLNDSDDDSDDEYADGYFEDFLDVIKLPLPLPSLTEKHFPAPQFLFFRPDDYALFKCFGKHNWCILTGNEGVAKSWFHWKFILLCYRQDLFNRFFSPLRSRAEEEEEEEEESLCGLKKIEDQTSTEQAQAEQSELKEDEPSNKKLKTVDHASMETEQIEQKDQSVVKHSDLFIPNLIVRTLAGKKSLLFFMDQTSDVLYVEQSPTQLHCFTDENSTILWEPASVVTPSSYYELKARMIATVPSDENIFHPFKSQAKKFYMPCPSELQLQLMGQVYRKFASDLQNFPTDAEIHEHVKKFGPFIHMVFFWSREERNEFEKIRQRQIARICSTDESLNSVAMTYRKYMETSRAMTGSIHCVSRYVVHLDKSVNFFGYANPHIGYCSAEIRNVILSCMKKFSYEATQQIIAGRDARDALGSRYSRYT